MAHMKITWKPMEDAPRDGTLIDLNFDGIRYTDCHFERGAWSKKHDYPSSLRIFLQEPNGWHERPEGLIQPYETNASGRKYIP